MGDGCNGEKEKECVESRPLSPSEEKAFPKLVEIESKQINSHIDFAKYQLPTYFGTHLGREIE